MVIKQLSLLIVMGWGLLTGSRASDTMGKDPQKALFFKTIQDSSHPDSVTHAQLMLAKIYIQKGELDSAKIYLPGIKKNIVQNNRVSNDILALYHMVMGMYHFEKSDYQKALSEYQLCLNFYRQLSVKAERPEVLEVKNDIGRVYIVLNELDKAKQHYEEVKKYLKTIRPSQIDSIHLSNMYNNLGVLHFYEGELDKAFDDYDMSRTIATMAGSPQGSNAGRAYYNMGMVREEKGYLVDAGIFYQKALEIYVKNYGKYHHHIAEVYGSIGNIHLTRYELQKARYYFQKDLKTSQHLYGDGHVETTWGYENLARTYQAEKKDSLAREMFLKVLKIREQAYHGKHIYISNVLLSLAELEKDPQLSIQQAKKARAIENEITSSATIGKWNISLHLLDKYIQLKRYQEAEKELKNAIQTGKKIAPNLRHNLLSKTYYMGSRLYLEKKNPEKSQFYIQKALESCLSDNIPWKAGEKIEPDWIHFIPEYLVAVTQQAEIAYQSGVERVLKQSAQNLQSALEVIRIHQRRRTSDDISKRYAVIYKGLYEEGLKTCVYLWQKTNDKNYLYQAFAYAERIKNSQSLELLHGMDSYKMSNLPETTLRKEYQLKKDILYYQSIYSDGTEEQQQKAAQKLFQLFKEEEHFYKNLKKIHPEYYQAKYNFNPLSIEEVQKKLSSPKEVIWHSTLIDGKEYLFIISKKEVKIIEPVNKDYNKILKEISQNELKKIIVIPDFSSKWINLEAIKQDGKYLIELLSFVYNISIFNYFNTNNESKLINKKILAFAPIDFSKYNLSSLTHSEDEIAGIKQFFSIKSFLGTNATKAEFHKNLLSYGGLHLSSHISYDPINPLKSKLYLSPNDSLDNGILYAHDIFGVPMRTHLVTLSACDAKKDQQDYIGIAGIADAFSYNGCKNILLSLWEVEDKVMKEITVGFYKYLSQGESKEEALRKAKTDYIKSADKYKSDPFYWSGIILQGDHQDLALAPSLWTRNWWVIALILLFFVLVFIKKL